MLIHIGFHKTATSWLQKEIFEKPGSGFQPLRVDESADAKAGGTPFSNTDARVFDAAQVLKIFKEQNPIDEKAVSVISNERLSGATISGGYDAIEIANRLHAVFPEAKILIGVREQFSMILSTYHQYLKRGGGHGLKCLLNLPAYGPVPGFNADHFKYEALISHYQKLFGKKNVMVYAYEVFQNNPNEILEALYEFSGAKKPESLPASPRANQSTAQFISYYTRHLGSLLTSDPANGYSALAIPWHPELGKKVLRIFRETIDLALPQSLDEWIKDKHLALLSDMLGSHYYAESNRTLQDITGLDLAALGYPVR